MLRLLLAIGVAMKKKAATAAATATAFRIHDNLMEMALSSSGVSAKSNRLGWESMATTAACWLSDGVAGSALSGVLLTAAPLRGANVKLLKP